MEIITVAEAAAITEIAIVAGAAVPETAAVTETVAAAVLFSGQAMQEDDAVCLYFPVDK